MFCVQGTTPIEEMSNTGDKLYQHYLAFNKYVRVTNLLKDKYPALCVHWSYYIASYDIFYTIL